MEFSPASSLACNLVENNPIIDSGRTFASFAEFDEVLQARQEETVQTLSRRSNKFDEGHPLRETLVYTELRYFCIHGGEPKWRGEGKRPVQRTRKTGCPVHFTLTGSKLQKRLIIRKSPDAAQHNHPLSHETWKLERENRKMDSADLKLAEELLEKNVPVSQVSFSFLVLKTVI